MKRKKNKGILILGIILGLCIAGGIALCVFLSMIQKPEKLGKPPKAESEVEGEQEKELGISEIEERIENFSVERANAQPVTPETTPITDPATQANAGDYLCSYSAERKITETDINALKTGVYVGLPAEKDILRMVINEMYARYGYEFSNPDIQQYFNQKQWYMDIVNRNADMDAIYQNMTELEKENIQFLTTNEE